MLFASRQSSFTPADSSVEVWQAGVNHAGQIVCTGPRYQYQYSSDNVHLPAPGYERLGQKYARSGGGAGR